jgi:hypothetical protein
MGTTFATFQVLNRCSNPAKLRIEEGDVMRGFVFFVCVVAVLVGALGYWRGWFIVDRARIREDTNKAIDRVEDVRDNVLKSNEKSSRSSDE